MVVIRIIAGKLAPLEIDVVDDEAGDVGAHIAELLQPMADDALAGALGAASNHTPAHNIPRTLSRLLANVLGVIVYGSVISSIHPVILALLIVSAAISWQSLSAVHFVK